MTKRIAIFGLLILVALASLAAYALTREEEVQENAPSLQTITVNEAHEQMQDNGDAVFVDVRTPEEYASGHPEGTVLIPLDELAQRAPDELPKDRAIYVICRTGNRSLTASETLIGLGYEQVYNVDGGTTAWAAQGLPMSMN